MFWQQIKAELQIDELRWMTLAEPLTLDSYQRWLAEDKAAEMHYLKQHLDAKANPKLLMPDLKSVLMARFSYLPHPFPLPENFPLKHLRIALYAQGMDYHFWLKDRLRHLSNKLQSLFPNNHFTAFTDSAPILERDLAYQAGLGWFGKNTCIIDPKQGSLFLLGELFCDLDLNQIDQDFLAPVLASPQPQHDFCGKCTACIDVCPTQALSERSLDANKCISYLTIETKSDPPADTVSKMGDWFFGCDLCQTVCPWNRKHILAKLTESQASQRTLLDLDNDTRAAMVSELRWLLTSSNKAIEKALTGSALLRARPRGLKRNALLVIANHQLNELHAEVAQLTNDKALSKMADYCLRALTS